MKVTLPRLDGRVSLVEDDMKDTPDLQEQLGLALDHLAEHVRKLGEQMHNSVSLDEFFSARTRGARNEADIVALIQI